MTLSSASLEDYLYLEISHFFSEGSLLLRGGGEL